MTREEIALTNIIESTLDIEEEEECTPVCELKANGEQIPEIYYSLSGIKECVEKIISYYDKKMNKGNCYEK